MSEQIENNDTPMENEGDIGGFLEFLNRMQVLGGSDSESPDIPGIGDGGNSGENDMDANDYHNKAVELVRRGKYKQAVALCMRGLSFYPNNVDLLADTIKYSSECGDNETADQHYQALCERVPRNRWNWRAYTFSFDYLISAVDDREPEIRTLLADYAKYLPFEEKRYMSESELETALGNHQRAMEVLEEAVKQINNAAQCALRLADMQLGHGMYEDVIKTTGYGLSASAETQPSINIPYLYYVRALAEDALLHKKAVESEIRVDDVRRLRSEYENMSKQFPELMRHQSNIQTRIKMLNMLEGAVA